MSSETFNFKHFSVRQDLCAMKIGTDGVLLGAMVRLENCRPHNIRVLDIGTGTGLIALMLAQRLEALEVDFQIDAVEIDKDAATQARGNFENSPWKGHLKVFGMSFDEFLLSSHVNDIKELGGYDLIVTNPPFYNATLKPEDEARAVARHKDSLPLRTIMAGCRQLLKSRGRLAMIYPMDYDTEVMTEALLAQGKPLRICNIVTKVGKPCKRRITEFSFGLGNPLEKGKTSLVCKMLAIRDEKGEYTREYRDLTQDFYVVLH